MTSSTHFAFSYLLTSAAGCSPQIALSGSLFSLLPDIDHPQSLIGRIFPSVSKYLLRKYGHRTVTHSVFAIVIVALVLSPALLFSRAFYIASVLAYSSHIFIDLFNRSGVKLFAPVSHKEYISFRTPELRILVSSWQEYLLFFIIVFLAFSVSGRSFSVTGAVRSVSKIFYKSYRTAIKDFHENSQVLCNAKIVYYDHVTRNKSTLTIPVLNLFPEKGFFIKGNERIVVPKEDIEKIEIFPTETKIEVSQLKGRYPLKLSVLPAGAFISGKIIIYDKDPGIPANDFVVVERGVDKTILKLYCAYPSEIAGLLSLDEERKREVETLRESLSAFQIKQLRRERLKIDAIIKNLKRHGFYRNYNRIILLNKKMKRIDSRIEAMQVSKAAGGDEKIVREIEVLEGGVRIEYEIVYFYLE